VEFYALAQLDKVDIATARQALQDMAARNLRLAGAKVQDKTPPQGIALGIDVPGLTLTKIGVGYGKKIKLGKGDTTRCYIGECLSASYRMHQDLKWEYIALIPIEKGAIISYENVMAWIEKELANDGSVNLYRVTDGQEEELYYSDMWLDDLNEQAKIATAGNWWWEEIKMNYESQHSY